jgi:hypothetical protein
MLRNLRMMELDIALKPVIELLCLAIDRRKVLKFTYYSKSSGEAKREIRPYMVIPNKRKNLELVGIPLEELNKPIDSREAGHYLLAQLLERIEMKQFEILQETFNDPGAFRDIVDDTQSKVVCRFIYDDENKREVKKQWLKIKYVK